MLKLLGRRTLGLAIAGAALLTGCAGHTQSVQADLSSPQSAALAFFQAIGRGDSATARNASVGGDQDKQWIDAMVTLIVGLRQYDQALRSRFGRDAAQTDADLRQALAGLTEDPITGLTEPIVLEDGESATVKPAYHHNLRLAARPPVYLRKIKDAWKVDLPATAQADPRHNFALVKQFLAAGQALQQAARQIAAGRYKTLAEAQQAIDAQLLPN